MEDFTAGNTQNQPSRRQTSLGPEWDQRIHQLVADWGAEKSPELVEEMIMTALKMARDKMGTADLKLMNRSLKEMRYAAKVFAGYREFRKVCVFGSARTLPTEPEFAVAEEFARLMVAEHYMVITGGGDGIMGAAQRGAGRENSFGLNIRLPFEQRANETIHGDAKLVNFNYFFTRKLNFVKETHALALFPGGFGTMDEGFEALTLMQTGKARIIPVVFVDRPNGTYWETWMKFLTEHLFKLGLIGEEDFHLFKIVHDAREGGAGDPALLQGVSLGALGGRSVGHPSREPADARGDRGFERQVCRPRAHGRHPARHRPAAGEKRAGDPEFAAVDSFSASAGVWALPPIDRRDQ